MNALIFAAGLGTRLQPLTLTRPKALVEVGGMTMLERTLRRVVEAGARRVVVNVHHFAQMVVEYLAELPDMGAEVVVSREDDLLLDTGGGLLRAIGLLDNLDEPLLVHNVDILSDAPLRDMARCHREGDADATLLVADRTTDRKLVFSQEEAGGTLAGWVNLRTGERRPPGLAADAGRLLAFGGIHVVTPSALLPSLEEYSREHGQRFPITPYYIDNCPTLNIQAYQAPGSPLWLDIGKPEALAQAEQLLR